LAEAVVELEKVSNDPVYLGKRQVINLRYFPQLAGGGKLRPPVCELVRSLMSGVQRTEVWEGKAALDFFAAPADSMYSTCRRAAWLSSAFMTIGDRVLEALSFIKSTASTGTGFVPLV
jgi:hypothetical protein